MSFSIGDVVMLKSGGPKMTVTYAKDREVFCRWFPDHSTDKSASFPPEALVAVKQ